MITTRQNAEATTTLCDARTINNGNPETFPAAWKVGDVIVDKYDVRNIFTSGGMGLVYHVHDRDWNIDLVIKTARKEFFQTQRQIQLFEKEAETWVDLGLHPHTVSCFYVRRLGEMPCIFAEYIDGGTLEEYISSKQLYAGSQSDVALNILDIAIQIARGIIFAHKRNLIHQDIKPLNILLSKDGTAKVSDFGLANARQHIAETNNVLTTSKQSLNLGNRAFLTPAYASPEQLNGERLTKHTDVWSFAATIVQMLKGEVDWADARALPHVLRDLYASKNNDRLGDLLARCLQPVVAKRESDLKTIEHELIEIYEAIANKEYNRITPADVSLDIGTLNNKAIAHSELKQYAKAEEAFQHGLELCPTNIELVFNSNMFLWRNGDISDREAANSLNLLKPFYESNWIWHYCMALIYIESLDSDYWAYIESGLLLDPGNKLLNALKDTPYETIWLCAMEDEASYKKRFSQGNISTPRYSAIVSAGAISINNTSTGAKVLNCEFVNEVTDFQVSDNFQTICGISNKNTIICWDPKHGKVIARKQLNQKWEAHLSLAPNGVYGLITYSTPSLFPPDSDEYRDTHIIKLPLCEEAGSLKGSNPVISDCGQMAITMRLSQVYLWNIQKKRCISTITTNAIINDLKLSCAANQVGIKCLENCYVYDISSFLNYNEPPHSYIFCKTHTFDAVARYQKAINSLIAKSETLYESGDYKSAMAICAQAIGGNQIPNLTQIRDQVFKIAYKAGFSKTTFRALYRNSCRFLNGSSAGNIAVVENGASLLALQGGYLSKRDANKLTIVKQSAFDAHQWWLYTFDRSNCVIDANDWSFALRSLADLNTKHYIKHDFQFRAFGAFDQGNIVLGTILTKMADGKIDCTLLCLCARDGSVKYKRPLFSNIKNYSPHFVDARIGAINDTMASIVTEECDVFIIDALTGTELCCFSGGLSTDGVSHVEIVQSENKITVVFALQDETPLFYSLTVTIPALRLLSWKPKLTAYGYYLPSPYGKLPRSKTLYRDDVSKFCISSDHKTIAVALESGNIDLLQWNLDMELKHVIRFYAHEHGVQDIHFSPDDKYLYSCGSRDGLIIQWENEWKYEV